MQAEEQANQDPFPNPPERMLGVGMGSTEVVRRWDGLASGVFQLWERHQWIGGTCLSNPPGESS